MKKVVLVICVVLVILVVACVPPTTHPFSSPIEKAHGLKAWKSNGVLKTDVKIVFRGETSIDGVMYFDPITEKARIENGDETIIWDGSAAWVSEDSDFRGARFHIKTWPYFLAVPFKLQDPGSELRVLGEDSIASRTFDVAELTFEGVGDSPDDWYIVFKDPKTNRVQALEYIVTYFGGDPSEASPSIAIYGDYQKVRGVVLPGTLMMWKWDSGLVGESFETVTFSNYEWIRYDKKLFEKEENMKEDRLP